MGGRNQYKAYERECGAALPPLISNVSIGNLAIKVRAPAFRNVKMSLSVLKMVIAIVSSRRKTQFCLKSMNSFGCLGLLFLLFYLSCFTFQILTIR